MRDRDKILHVDGLPGVIIPGQKGDDGVRGCEVMLATYTENPEKLKFKIRVSGKGIEKTMTSMNKPLSYVSMKGDFIIHVDANRNTLYAITDILREDELIYIVDELDTWRPGDTLDNAFDICVAININKTDISYTAWDGQTVKGKYIKTI